MPTGLVLPDACCWFRTATSGALKSSGCAAERSTLEGRSTYTGPGLPAVEAAKAADRTDGMSCTLRFRKEGAWEGERREGAIGRGCVMCAFVGRPTRRVMSCVQS